MAKKTGQQELKFKTWGGKRKGVRPPAKTLAFERAAQEARALKLSAVHVTLRLADGVPSLRTRLGYDAIVRATGGRGAHPPLPRCVAARRIAQPSREKQGALFPSARRDGNLWLPQQPAARRSGMAAASRSGELRSRRCP